MPAVVSCPKCKKKYTLPDKLLGKLVKCTECHTQFKTPARSGQAKPQQKSLNPQQLAAKKKAQAAAAEQAQELKRLGVDGPIQRAADVFAGVGRMQGTPDPLANHMIEDPGFGDGSALHQSDDDSKKPVDPNASMFANPALAPKKKTMAGGSSKKEKANGKWNTQPWFILSAVFVPLFVISIVLSLTGLIPASANMWVALVLNGLFGLAGFIVGIWGLMLVYEASESILQVVLCLLVPFYIIYFIIVNWEIMKPYAFALIAAVLIFVLAVASVMLAGAFAVGDGLTAGI